MPSVKYAEGELGPYLTVLECLHPHLSVTSLRPNVSIIYCPASQE